MAEPIQQTLGENQEFIDFPLCRNCGKAKAEHIAVIDGKVLLCGATGRLARSCYKAEGTTSELVEKLADAGQKEAATLLIEARATLTAVLHQLEHGEASDLIDGGIGNAAWLTDARRDLKWCRSQIKSLVKAFS